MYSRRAIVLAMLIGLAFIASTTHPWIHGSRLLASKYADEFLSGVGYEGSFRAVDDSFHKEFGADGIRSIQVEARVGNITVTGTHDNEISIDGELIAYGPSNQIAQDRLRYVCLDAVQDGDMVRVVGSVMRPEPSSPDVAGPNGGGTNIVLRVPSGLAVDLRTSAGKVTLDGLSGMVETHVDVGSVEARSITGNLTIGTSAGRISVTNAAIKEELSLTTSMGDIEFEGSLGTRNYVEVSAGRVQMTVPRSTCVRLDAATNAGQVNTNLPVTEHKSEAMKSSAVGILGQGQPTGDLQIRVSMGEINISGK
jgi:hypothetical protein